MRRRDVGKLDCTIARTLSVIGDRWTMLVLRDAFLGTSRFEAFQASLGPRELGGRGVRWSQSPTSEVMSPLPALSCLSTQLRNRLRHFVDDEGPLAPGFIAVGDAL